MILVPRVIRTLWAMHGDSSNDGDQGYAGESSDKVDRGGMGVKDSKTGEDDNGRQG